MGIRKWKLEIGNNEILLKNRLKGQSFINRLRIRKSISDESRIFIFKTKTPVRFNQTGVSYKNFRQNFFLIELSEPDNFADLFQCF